MRPPAFFICFFASSYWGKEGSRGNKHRFHPGMIFQIPEHIRVVAVIRSRRASRVLKPLYQQPCIEGLNATANGEVFTVKNFFHHLPAAGQYATQGIAVPADIFCCGLHTDINSHRYGFLIKRGTVGVIH